MQERPPFSAIDGTITSRYLLPVVGAVRPEHDLAVAGAVDLDPRVVLPGRVEATSPKTIPRPQRRRISPAPAWSVG